MSTDRFTVRAVVVFLGIGMLASLGLGGYLAAVGRTVPDFVISLGSGAIGALGAVLARTSTDEPQQVVGPAGGPVAVEEVAP